MKGLTRRQQEVLDFIRRFIAERKYPPTLREIGDHFGISVKGGFDHVKALEKKHAIRCQSNRSRAIEIIEEEPDGNGSPRTHAVPVLGKVAAGKPLFVEENFERVVQLPSEILGSGRHFAVNVAGDSMRDAGILDGDLAVVRHQTDASNGDIVIAMVDDEAVTLKRFFKKTNSVELRPENPRFHSIFSQNVRILGKLACIVRRYGE
jgi:repressor LexA